MIRKNHRLLSKVFQIKYPISSSINLLFLKSICVIFFRQIKRRAKKMLTRKISIFMFCKIAQRVVTRSDIISCAIFFVQICVKILLELWNFSYIIFDSIPYFSVGVNFTFKHSSKKKI